MDYSKFYSEVVQWIGQANQMAVHHGLGSELFWDWVTNSTADICRRYDNNELVIKQMVMLSEWLEQVYEKSKG